MATFRHNLFWLARIALFGALPSLAHAELINNSIVDLCQGAYARIGSRSAAEIAAAKEDYDRVASVKISDMFKATERTNLDGTKKGMLDITEKEVKAYRQHFDDYINLEGGKDGMIPSDILQEYRKWLKTTYGAKYPKLSSFEEELFTLQQRGATLKEFDDYVFFKFVREKYGQSPASIESFVKAIGKNRAQRMVARYLSVAKGGGKWFLDSTWASVKAGAFLVPIGILFIDPFKNTVASKSKDLSELANSTILSVTKGAEIEEALKKVLELLDKWEKDSYAKESQDAASKRFRGISKLVEMAMPPLIEPLILPKVDPNLLSDLEKILNADKADLSIKLDMWRDLSNQIAEENGKLALDDDKENAKVYRDMIKKLTPERNQVEEEVATKIANWLLFSYFHGDKNPPPRDLAESYFNALNSYITNGLNLDVLRRKTIGKVREELKKGFDAGALKAPEPAPAPTSVPIAPVPPFATTPP